MPELPETETIARDLDGALRGAVLREVSVLRTDVLRGFGQGGRALRGAAATRVAREMVARLSGATIATVWRRAKSVVVDCGDAGRLVVTPRFTGALLIDPPADDPYACAQMQLADGRRLVYRDLRRLGTLTLLNTEQFSAWDRALGPEPLDPDLTPERFSGILRGSIRAVKSILMDQRKLAGVGNIYANEACWRAGLRPARRGRTLTHANCAALLGALREVLSESIALRGTTFRDYQDAFGGRGGFAARLAVYGRGGLPCLRCSAALRETHALEGRSTVWCPACQH